jgi:hypothetical protein
MILRRQKSLAPAEIQTPDRPAHNRVTALKRLTNNEEKPRPCGGKSLYHVNTYSIEGYRIAVYQNTYSRQV